MRIGNQSVLQEPAERIEQLGGSPPAGAIHRGRHKIERGRRI